MVPKKLVHRYNPAHSIVKINYALEILKLFCENGTGEGIPINICILPDFAIDFDQEVLEAKYKNSTDKKLKFNSVNQIGGRAARIAKDLVYLRYANDGCFKINLMCKTDDVGYALLNKYLIQTLDKKYHPLDLSNIHNGQLSRATLRNGQHVIMTTPPDDKNELNLQDIQLNGYDTIEKSTLIMVTSVKTPDYNNMLDFICKSDKDNTKKIILDTSRCEKIEDWKNFINSFNNYKNCVSGIIFDNVSFKGLIKVYNDVFKDSSFKPSTSLHDVASDLFEKFKVPILILNENYFIWIDKDKKIQCPMLGDISFDNLPDSTESFKAGFLLGFAVLSELDKWKNNHNKGDVIDFTQTWCLEIEDVLSYAGLICGAWSELLKNKHEYHPDKRYLLRYAFRLPDQSEITIPHKDFHMLLNEKPTTAYWELNDTKSLEDTYNRNTNEPLDKICFLESLKDNSQITSNMNLMKMIANDLEFKIVEKSIDKVKIKELRKVDSRIFNSIAIINLLNYLRGKKESKSIIPNIFELSNYNEKRKSDNNLRRVVLIDLDNTLLDSVAVRVKSLSFSMKNISQIFLTNKFENEIERNKFTIFCVDLYERFIYDRWPFYLNPKINLGNFRQQWNLPHSYSMLIYLINIFCSLDKDNNLKEQFYDSYFYNLSNQLNELEKDLSTVNNKSLKFTEKKQAINQIKDQITKEKVTAENFISKTIPVIEITDLSEVINFLRIIKEIQPNTKKDKIDKIIVNHENTINKVKRSISEIETKYSRDIAETVHKFKEAHFPPYKEAISFIESIRNVGDIEVYIATEGHHETQLLKLRQAGISDIFPEECVLSTGLVSTPSKDLENIRKVLKENEKDIERRQEELIKLNGIITGIEIVKYPIESNYFNEVIEFAKKEKIKLIQKKERVQNKLSKLNENKVMLNKYRSVFDKFSEKAQKAFFALSIYSIINNKKAPQEFLKTFSNIIFEGRGQVGKEVPMKVIMIGDRHKYDIVPVLDLFRKDKDKTSNITTIRIKTKKYLDEPSSYNDERECPDFIVSTLEEAKCLLLEKSIWDNAPNIFYPVILDFPVINWDDLNMIIWAKNRNDITSIIATQIIEENCNVNTTNFYNIIVHYLKYLFGENKEFNLKTPMNYTRYIGLLNVLSDATDHIYRLINEGVLDKVHEEKCDELVKLLDDLFNHFYLKNKNDKSFIDKTDNLQKLIVNSLNNLKQTNLISQYFNTWNDDQVSFGKNTCMEMLRIIGQHN